MLKKMTDCEGCKRRREKLKKYAAIAQARAKAFYLKNGKNNKGGAPVE